MAFGGFDQNNSQAPISEINMVPLIDVMLVLLIIFMITAPLLTHAVKIDLPTANSQLNAEKPEQITLSLNAAGQMYWNDEAIGDAQLPQRLQQAAARQPLVELHLRADRETRYQKLAEVMSAAREAGIQKLGFVTTPDPKQRNNKDNHNLP